MAWQFKFGNQPRFNGRENTSSGQAPRADETREWR